jgi:hypothetical protein
MTNNFLYFLLLLEEHNLDDDEQTILALIEGELVMLNLPSHHSLN